MEKNVIIKALGLSIVLVVGATSLFMARSRLPQTDSAEARIAHFEQDQAAFVKQVETTSGEYVVNAGVPIFENHVVPISPPRVKPDTTSRVLGVDTAQKDADKWIEIDLSEQRLTTWQKDKKVKDYPVSTGLASSPTVKGEYRVWRKVLSQGYRGGSKARGTYYYLPNVPYSLFFHNGYAIHAAYWHNDFGIRPRSHGCVNMKIEDAKEVYEWATPVMPAGFTAFNADEGNPGTRIVIHD